MKTFYYSLATLTALLCLNISTENFNDSEDIDVRTQNIQHIDMSDYAIHINLKRKN